jgi:hypothetical protein
MERKHRGKVEQGPGDCGDGQAAVRCRLGAARPVNRDLGH